MRVTFVSLAFVFFCLVSSLAEISHASAVHGKRLNIAEVVGAEKKVVLGAEKRRKTTMNKKNGRRKLKTKTPQLAKKTKEPKKTKTKEPKTTTKAPKKTKQPKLSSGGTLPPSLVDIPSNCTLDEDCGNEEEYYCTFDGVCCGYNSTCFAGGGAPMSAGSTWPLLGLSTMVGGLLVAFVLRL